jgi:hypothetical protein
MFEEPSAGNPHAGFRGGWVAQGGQPFYPELQEFGDSGAEAPSTEREERGDSPLNYGACRLLDEWSFEAVSGKTGRTEF